MENYYFKNPLNEFKKIVYYKDYELLLSDLNKILSKEKDFHNMQYRWLNKEVYLFGLIVEVQLFVKIMK